MLIKPVRTVLFASVAVGLLCCLAADSYAQCCGPQVGVAAPAVAYRPAYVGPRWPRILWPPAWFRPRPRVALMPVAAAPVVPTACASPCTTCASPCDPCGGQCTTTCCRPVTTRSVQYVPQTAYRTQVYSVPVTTYRPVTTCDPCSGCTTTCMKPCTSYVQQSRQVAYTTYRPVYQYNTTMQCTTTTACSPCAPTVCPTGCCPTGACTCPTGACAAGACPTGACGVQTGAQTGVVTPRPTLAPAQQQDAYRPQAESNGYGNGNGNGNGGGNDNVQPQPAPRVEQMQNLESPPRLPSEYDKTALLESREPIRRISHTVAKPARQLDDSGWQAAR